MPNTKQVAGTGLGLAVGNRPMTSAGTTSGRCQVAGRGPTGVSRGRRYRPPRATADPRTSGTSWLSFRWRSSPPLRYLVPAVAAQQKVGRKLIRASFHGADELGGPVSSLRSYERRRSETPGREEQEPRVRSDKRPQQRTDPSKNPLPGRGEEGKRPSRGHKNSLTVSSPMKMSAWLMAPEVFVHPFRSNPYSDSGVFVHPPRAGGLVAPP